MVPLRAVLQIKVQQTQIISSPIISNIQLISPVLVAKEIQQVSKIYKQLLIMALQIHNNFSSKATEQVMWRAFVISSWSGFWPGITRKVRQREISRPPKSQLKTVLSLYRRVKQLRRRYEKNTTPWLPSQWINYDCKVYRVANLLAFPKFPPKRSLPFIVKAPNPL